MATPVEPDADADAMRTAAVVDGAGRRRVWAALALVVVTASQVAASQMTRLAQADLKAPFFVMCLHTAAMSVCLPLAPAVRKQGGSGSLGWRPVLLLLPLWLASSYFYVDALVFAPAGLVQTIFGTAPAIVAVLSRAFLAEPLTWRRLAAALAAFAGMLCVGVAAWRRNRQHGGGAGGALAGAGFAGCAVLAAAGYKVGFKRRFGDASGSETLAFVGRLGAAAGLLGLPVAAAFGALGVETRWWHPDVAVNWPLLLASAAVDAVYGIALTLGVAMAGPALMAFGTILGIPANLAIDAALWGARPGALEAVGAALVALSFLLCVSAPAPRPLLPREAADPEEAPRPYCERQRLTALPAAADPPRAGPRAAQGVSDSA